MQERLAAMEEESAFVVKEVTVKLDAHSALLREQGQEIREMKMRLAVVENHFGAIDNRLNRIDERLTSLDENVKARFEAQDKKLDQLLHMLTTLTTTSE